MADSTIKGDVNLDGNVTNADIDILSAYVDGDTTLTGQALSNADVNSDGVVNEEDIEAIIQNNPPTIEWVSTIPATLAVVSSKTFRLRSVIKNHSSYAVVKISWYENGTLASTTTCNLLLSELTSSYRIDPSQITTPTSITCVVTVTNLAGNMTEESYTTNVYVRNNDGLGVTLLGDVNCDGVIDNTDYTLLDTYLSDPINNTVTDQGLVNADMDGNGVVDVNDLQSLKNMIDSIPLYGDANGDRVVNIADVVKVALYIESPDEHPLTTHQLTNADVDLDGDVDEDDKSHITESLTPGYKLPR